MVNQDKASKQIALLRQEIQQLTLELTEYKQGKRTTDSSGEYMTDTYHELEMLRTENEMLRMRTKALQKNIDSQSIQLTELKVTSALACVTSGIILLSFLLTVIIFWLSFSNIIFSSVNLLRMIILLTFALLVVLKYFIELVYAHSKRQISICVAYR